MESFEAAHIIGCLRQQPLAEHCDFGKRRSRLRADDPVRLRHSQRNIDWPYKTTVDEIPSRKRSASERNPMAVDGSIYQHARAVQNRTVSNGIGYAGGLKPSRPGLPIIKAQQRKLQQIRRSGYAVASRNKLGAADRKKLLGAKAHDAKPSPVAIAMSNGKVNLLTREVDVMHRCGHSEIDVAMGLGKPTEPMYEPFGSKIR
jgi:hypothetical protein